MIPRPSFSWLILFGGLGLTLVAAFSMKSGMDRFSELNFESHCGEICTIIANRLDDHARILLGSAALFNVSDKVTREGWRTFSLYQKLEKQLPGIQGIGFSLLIPRADLARHIQDIRSEGFPEYTVKPEGDRELYSSIIYLEPFSGRNLRAFGYDMFSEPVRRLAMERARDTDAAALSGKVVLVQETGAAVQAGTLMYVPVYRKGMAVTTVEQRRAAIYGWVYSPYRMTDLMEGMLGDSESRQELKLHLEVFDGEQLLPQNLLFTEHPATGGRNDQRGVRFTHQIPVTMNGHRWTLRFTQAGVGCFALEYMKIWITLAGGTVITLLLFALIRVLQNVRVNAQRLAEELTVTLRESEASYRNQFTNNSAVMLLVDPDNGAIIDANAAAVSFYGYPREQLLAMNISDINALAMPEVQEKMASVPQKLGKLFEFQHRLADRTLRDVEVSSSRIQFGGCVVLHSIITDVTERKKTEMALRDISERLALATRAGNVGIWDWDVVNNILVWDDQMYRLYGITPDKFSGAYPAWQAGLHPDDRDQGDLEIQMALSGEKEFNTEFRVLWPDGSIRNIRAMAQVQRDESGHPLRMIGTNWDVTQSKLLEEKLKSSEQNFRMFFETVDDLIVVGAPEGRILFTNAAVNRRLGYSSDELQTMKILDLHPEAYRKEAEIIFGAMFRAARSFCPLPLQAKNGRHLPVETRVWFGKWNEQDCIFGVSKDLTALKQAEASLTDISQMQKLLMELSSQYINIPLTFVPTAIQLSLERMGKFVSADRAYVFRYDFEKGITSNTFEWCNTDIEPQIDQLKEVPLDMIPDWVRAHESGAYMYIEDVDALPTGSLREILEPQGIKSLIAVPMLAEPQCIGFVGFDSVRKHHSYTDKEISLLSIFSQMLVNVEMRAKAERDLLQSNQQLEAATVRSRELASLATQENRAKSRFLAHMSHEIRTPLNAILGFSQLLQQDQGLALSQKQRVEIINSSGEHLLALLNNILELSKIEAGGVELSPISFDFHAMMNDLILIFRIRAEAKHLSLHLEGLEQGLRYLFADEQKLRQVLINLLSNAVKYTASGSIQVRVSTGQRVADEWRLNIVIEDSGSGIAAEEMNRLFIPFEQTSSGRSSHAGTGLGLAISRQFARLMGGDVTGISEVGKGSVFRLELPVKEGTAIERPDTRHVLRLDGGQPRCRILVAEDDADSRLFLFQLLGGVGFDVVEATNGKEAVEAFTRSQPQLVLMDDWMPLMQGDEAISQIRQKPGGARVKIITLTANASDETRHRSIAAGTDIFMAKPFQARVLFDHIQVLLGVRYNYAEFDLTEDVSPEVLPVLTREMLDSLPGEVRSQLRVAALGCRQDQLLKLTHQLTGIAPEIARSLQDLVINFEYHALSQLLN
jgi:PAS domain S-box-containing protein